MTTIREANAVWDGNIEDGSGNIDRGGRAPVRFARQTRYSEGEADNPETMAAGALAGSYAMALAAELAETGFTPSRIQVSARVVLERTDQGTPFVPTVDLNARAQVNNVDHDTFLKLADAARANCPMANLFAGAEVTLEADTIGG